MPSTLSRLRSQISHPAWLIAAALAFPAAAMALSFAAVSRHQATQSFPPAAPSPAGPPAAPPGLPAPRGVTESSLAGAYEGNQMEVAACLLLKPDGHFDYELAYGALDETATGTWVLKFGAVYLNTVPAVVPPRFVVVSDLPDPKPGLWIKLVNPIQDGGRQRIDLFYGPPGDQIPEPGMAEVADDGSVPLPGNRLPTAIALEIPVYPATPKAIPLAGPGGHHLTLRFEPNDIGKADFHFARLGIEDGVLIMPRRDLQLELHFKRQP